ncbi:MAG TPA: TIGR00296 family protein [Bacteroidetes bacterium]|nr:TIGR00296 family protein [Bacteroidota bacterium]
MKKLDINVISILSLFIVVSSCHAQEVGADRQPAVAGQFYPSNKDELRSTLKRLFSEAVPAKHLPNVVAIISPHAGYPYSGGVAASSFNQIDPAAQYDNIFVIGPSHHVGFEGASVYASGDYVTPLGKVKVNKELAKQLIKSSTVFTSRTDAHVSEHSVEVQLPFLQYVLKKDFRIVPIVIGANVPETCELIAKDLRPYLNQKNLFVISTDFSHYPTYEDAKSVDRATADAVLSNSATNLINAIDRNARKNIPNLSTSMCGWSCVLTLLYMTQDSLQIAFTPIEYKNSGDASIGDKRQVVGYHAIAVSLKEKDSGFNLNDKEKKDLLAIARDAIDHHLKHENTPELDAAQYSEVLRIPCGAFVTLNKHHALRGCIGHFGSEMPLFRVVQEMAVAAAVQDYRFPPVELNEMEDLDIEISVLTPMKKVSSIDEIELGKHGIYIRKGAQGGTFLPQVATETGWTKEEFLGHCAQDKAGIGWDGWKNADIFIYEALVFGEREGN